MATKGIAGAKLTRPGTTDAGRDRRLSTALASRNDDFDTGAIAPNPRNPEARVDPATITELVESIRQVGVLQPLTLVSASVWLGDFPEDAEAIGEASWVAIAGHRRHTAAQLAGQTTVPAILRDDLAGRLDEILLHENLHRLDLTPLQEAFAYQRLVDKGMGQREIAASVGVSQGQVSKRLSLLRLPEAIIRNVETGAVGMSQAQAWAREVPDSVLAEVGSTWSGTGSAYDAITSAYRTVSERDAEQRARAKAQELGADLVSRKELSSKNATQLWSQRDITAAQKAGALVVVSGGYRWTSEEGRDPEFYTVTENKGPSAADLAKREDNKLKKAAAAARWEALIKIAGKAPTAGVLRDALVTAVQVDLNLNGSDTGKYASRLGQAIGFGPKTDNHYDWRRAASKLPASDHFAWLILLGAYEAWTRFSWTSWNGAESRAYYALLRSCGYQPTKWETAKINTKKGASNA